MVSAPASTATASTTHTAIETHRAGGRSPGASGCGAGRVCPPGGRVSLLCVLAIRSVPQETSRGRRLDGRAFELAAQLPRRSLGILRTRDRAQDDRARGTRRERLV